MFSPAGVSRSYTDLFEGPFMVFLNQDSASRGRPKAPEGLAALPESRSVSREFDFALKLWRGKRKKEVCKQTRRPPGEPVSNSRPIKASLLVPARLSGGH